jgi:hypothetical protein
MYLITTAPQFINIFKGMALSLPVMTIAFLNYWYVWVILLGVLFIAGIFLEIFARGKWRWANFSLSIFTMLLCGLIFFGYILAALLPIFAIQNMLIK